MKIKAETKQDILFAAEWLFFGFVLGLLAALEWAYYLMNRR